MVYCSHTQASLSIFFFFINDIKKNSSQIRNPPPKDISIRSQNPSLELHRHTLKLITSTIPRSSVYAVYVLVYIQQYTQLLYYLNPQITNTNIPIPITRAEALLKL